MPRLLIAQAAPEGYRAVLALDRYLTDHLDGRLLDLVKLRASQLNGCAYCVDLHAQHLLAREVPLRTVLGVVTWRETPFFDDRERAALALTEEVTRITGGVSEDTWASAAAVFGERELADLVLAIGSINLQNRMGVSTHLQPPREVGA